MVTVQDLYVAACNASEQAYAPYSHFKVGAAVLGDNGKLYTGCNVENVSFPCGTCAEAGAIAAMVTGGGRKIKEILIFADGKQLIKPCGACLQRIAEFASPETLIYLADPEAIRQKLSLSDLLPLSFSAEELSE